ncbi:MAG: glutathione S-transferase family protein [Pseudomonadota bacterium]
MVERLRQLRLTHFKLCPFSRAIRLVLGELGLRPEFVDVQPWALDRTFLAANPAGTLPVVETRDGRLLIGAYATAEFIDDLGSDEAIRACFAAEPATVERSSRRLDTLFPGDIDSRAEVRRLIDWFHLKFDREVSQELLHEKVRPVLDRKTSRAPDAAMLRAARANLKYHLSYVGFLADQRRWLGGDEISYADLAAAAHLSIADYLGEIDWEDVPYAQVWYQLVKSRPSFRPLLEDRVPGVAPPAHYAELDF